MGSYSHWMEEKDCPHCGAHNFIVIGSAGNNAANETENINCFKCEKVIDRTKCFRTATGATAEDAQREHDRQTGMVF